MDSDDEEMLAALMEEEADGAATDDEEHCQMLAYLAGLYAEARWLGTTSRKERATAVCRRLLHAVRRLLRRRSIAR